ncbi:Clp protease N-terminal domain-containing protein [Planctomycetota bacterium]|nr:Clp protease N-terminal domain-containing protein [Planctomycetota bacterium]
MRNRVDHEDKDWLREHSKLGLARCLWLLEVGYLAGLSRSQHAKLSNNLVLYAALESGNTPASRLIELSGTEEGWHGVELPARGSSEVDFEVDMEQLLASPFAVDALLDAANVALAHEHSMVGTEHLLLHTLNQLLKANSDVQLAGADLKRDLEYLCQTVSDLIADEDYPWFKDGKTAAMDVDLIADTDPTPARKRMQDQRLYWSIMNG